MSQPRVAPRSVDGILLLYHNVPPDSSTILEHVDAFVRHSRFPVWTVNTDHGFPPALESLRPRIVLLHYSLFGTGNYMLGDRFVRFLEGATDNYRIAFFQDEYQHCPTRFRFIDEHRIDCVYTLLEPRYHDLVYGRNTHGPRTIYTLPGYVSDALVDKAARNSLPDERRHIDIGYRGRSLPFWMGRGSQEKREIGIQFRELARDSGLLLDIAVDEDSRLYGGSWSRFLAETRGFLGVEAGVSIFDLTGEAYSGYERLVAESPTMTFDHMSARLLARFEGNVPYRTVSPRHFEAAAFRVAQILFEGAYSGILQPMVHYLPLKKDFSNFDEIVGLFRDPDARRAVTDRAHTDLIASGRHSYARFIGSFDDDLVAAGFTPASDTSSRREIAALLTRGTALRRLRARGRPYYRTALPHAFRVGLRGVIDTVRARLGSRGGG